MAWQGSNGTQITIEFNTKTAIALNQWLARTAPAIGPRNYAAEAITAMIRSTLRYTDVTDAVASQITNERAAARERGQR